MPSPFPGMDPYLESPDWFPNLHDGLIFTIQAALIEPPLPPEQAEWVKSRLVSVQA
jgi:hypothetical protein